MGILGTLDALIQTFVAPLNAMGGLLMQNVTLTLATGPSTMPLSTAALTGFVMPWVNDLGNICFALAKFMAAL